MSAEHEFNPGFPPGNAEEEMRGLEQAIRSTNEKIAAFKSSGSDTSDLEQHLQSLEARWYAVEDKRSRRAA